MRYLKWGVWTLVVLGVCGFLHYTLPRNEVVRIVDTEVRRIEVGENALFWASSEPSNPTSGNRDVKFISAVYENGEPRVYRNEDTGWLWPPYIKLDSSDMQARASSLTSSPESPRWVLITYYGVRSQILSIFPNTLGIREVDGPDDDALPWTRIIMLVVIAVAFLVVRAAVKAFWRNRIDPIVDEVRSAFGDAESEADARIAGAQRRFRGRKERVREWWTETFG